MNFKRSKLIHRHDQVLIIRSDKNSSFFHELNLHKFKFLGFFTITWWIPKLMFSYIFLGFNLRTTFRINTTPDGSYKTWRSQRSAVSYDAFKALIKSDIVPPGQRKDRLMAILDHLDIDIMGLTRAREVCIKAQSN